MTSSAVGGPRGPSGPPPAGRAPAPAGAIKRPPPKPTPKAPDKFGDPVSTAPSPKPPQEHPFQLLRTELLRIAAMVPVPTLEPIAAQSWGVEYQVDLCLSAGALRELEEVRARLAEHHQEGHPELRELPEPQQRTHQALELCDAVMELSARYPGENLVDHLAEKELRAASLYYLAGAAAASGGALGQDRLAEIAGSVFVHILQKVLEQHARITSQGFTHDLDGLPQLRRDYIQEVAELAAMVPVMAASGASPKSVASAVHAGRRAIGIEYKNLTPPELREQIYQRNQERYGDPLGPTLPWLAGRGRTPTGIIDGGIRTGGGDLRAAFLESVAATAQESVK
jgi:hypothetical protein